MAIPHVELLCEQCGTWLGSVVRTHYQRSGRFEGFSIIVEEEASDDARAYAQRLREELGAEARSLERAGFLGVNTRQYRYGREMPSQIRAWCTGPAGWLTVSGAKALKFLEIAERQGTLKKLRARS
jgi:hypothetical protein